MRRLVAALRASHEERGTTLIELTVAMLIFGVVMAMVMGAFLAFQNRSTDQDNRLENLSEARVMMDAITKDVRTATMLTAGTSPFTVATPTHVTFYANVDSTTGPSKVDLSIDTTVPTAPMLVEKVTPPDPGSNPPTFTTQSPVTRLVGRYVTNTTSNPLFTFFDATGTAMTSPVTGSNLLTIRQVGINLQVRKSVQEYLPSTTLTSTVSMPNVYYNIVASPSP